VIFITLTVPIKMNNNSCAEDHGGDTPIKIPTLSRKHQIYYVLSDSVPKKYRNESVVSLFFFC
jgi:hypothetical protein